jgi:hypothetical protein
LPRFANEKQMQEAGVHHIPEDEDERPSDVDERRLVSFGPASYANVPLEASDDDNVIIGRESRQRHEHIYASFCCGNEGAIDIRNLNTFQRINDERGVNVVL